MLDLKTIQLPSPDPWNGTAPIISMFTKVLSNDCILIGVLPIWAVLNEDSHGLRMRGPDPKNTSFFRKPGTKTIIQRHFISPECLQ
jgi:hypothetical protein